MNKYSMTALAILLLGPAQAVWPFAPQDSCAITYVANEGFLIETRHHKILIDALFGGIKGDWCAQPNDSLSGLMLRGTAPFDNIDIVLVSHKHTDHFNGPMVIGFLKNNSNTVLICPDQVDGILRKDTDYPKISDRITSLKSGSLFDTLLSVVGIAVRVMRFNHGSYLVTDTVSGKKYDVHADVENFGYEIEADGFTFFHSGDASTSPKSLYEVYNTGRRQMDAVFLDRVFLGRDGQELISAQIRSRNIIFMHIEPAKVEYFKSVVQSVPEMFVFTGPMEKKIIRKDVLPPEQ